MCPLFRHMWRTGASESWTKKAHRPPDVGAATSQFSGGPFRSHQLQLVMRGSIALEAEQPALFIPGKRHVTCCYRSREGRTTSSLPMREAIGIQHLLHRECGGVQTRDWFPTTTGRKLISHSTPTDLLMLSRHPALEHGHLIFRPSSIAGHGPGLQTREDRAGVGAHVLVRPKVESPSASTRGRGAQTAGGCALRKSGSRPPRMGLGTNPDQLENRAGLLRDALARHTPSLKALFRPATVSRQVRTLNACHS